MSIYVDIEKSYGDFHLKAKFEAGDEVLALLGASGCGKSLTLKCVAGIETPDRGRIVLNNTVLFDSDKKINLPPQKRHTGYLFQQYALFPNMTVRQNIRCGVLHDPDRDNKVDEIIHVMHLDGLESKKPRQLSGGQQQRTALARILISSPEIILLDEPFSALDSHLRFQLEHEVREVIKQFGKTVILVSHDRDEVFRLSDKIAVVNNGIVETVGAKKDIFADPGSVTGAVLTGCKNISKVTKLSGSRYIADDWGIEFAAEKVSRDFTHVGIRMHSIKPGNPGNGILCPVTDVIENTFSYTIMLSPSSDCKKSLAWETDKSTWNSLCADKVYIQIDSNSFLLLKE